MSDMPSGKPTAYGKGRHRLYVETCGDAAGTPVILVHGLSGSRRWWQHNVGALAERHTVHVIELIGYGMNRALLPTRIETAAEAIGEFIALLPSGCAHPVLPPHRGPHATVRSRPPS